MEWYYSIDGDRVGPISEDEFNAAVGQGTITAETLVWNDTMAEWQAYSTIAGGPAGPAVSAMATQASEPSAEPDKGGNAVCRECGTIRSADAMTPYGDQWVCGQCKNTFFQKIREGVNVDRAGRAGGTGGATPNVDLMAQARNALTDRWGLAVGTFFLLGLMNLTVAGVFQGITMILGFATSMPQYSLVIIGTVLGWLGILASGPLAVGLAKFTLNLCDDNSPDLNDLFHGFSKFGQAFSAIFIQTVILQMLYLPGQTLMQSAQSLGPEMVAVGGGLMVLAAPVGVFLALSWCLTPFAIADNDDLGGVAALKYSWNLMNGNRFKVFCLFCRFIGWYLLAILTCLIGLLWLNPYVKVSMGMFYRDVHDEE